MTPLWPWTLADSACLQPRTTRRSSCSCSERRAKDRFDFRWESRPKVPVLPVDVTAANAWDAATRIAGYFREASARRALRGLPGPPFEGSTAAPLSRLEL